MGTKSFGKGSVQTIQELRNGSAVKLTTARYFTPNGRSIQARGIVPDISLNTLKIAASDKSESATFSESDLDGRLSNPNGDSDDTGDSANTTEDTAKLAETDFQLFEALNLLKGLHILNQLKNS